MAKSRRRDVVRKLGVGGEVGGGWGGGPDVVQVPSRPPRTGLCNTGTERGSHEPFHSPPEPNHLLFPHVSSDLGSQ